MGLWIFSSLTLIHIRSKSPLVVGTFPRQYDHLRACCPWTCPFLRASYLTAFCTESYVVLILPSRRHSSRRIDNPGVVNPSSMSQFDLSPKRIRNSSSCVLLSQTHPIFLQLLVLFRYQTRLVPTCCTKQLTCARRFVSSYTIPCAHTSHFLHTPPTLCPLRIHLNPHQWLLCEPSILPSTLTHYSRNASIAT